MSLRRSYNTCYSLEIVLSRFNLFCQETAPVVGVRGNIWHQFSYKNLEQRNFYFSFFNADIFYANLRRNLRWIRKECVNTRSFCNKIPVTVCDAIFWAFIVNSNMDNFKFSFAPLKLSTEKSIQSWLVALRLSIQLGFVDFVDACWCPRYRSDPNSYHTRCHCVVTMFYFITSGAFYNLSENIICILMY